MLNSGKIKKDFPIFQKKVNGKRLVYLDSAATSQKPRSVIEAVSDYYSKFNSPVHRSVYSLAEKATERYEKTREKTAEFLGAREAAEVIFLRNTTEAINLVAKTLGREIVKKGDNILITEMEHHSNLLPWQQLSGEKGAELRFIPFNKEGKLEIGKLDKLMDSRTKILSLVHVSNFLGTINPVRKIIAAAKRKNKNIITLIDGAQSAPHFKINVQKLGCDFFAFSSHKILGPSGVGLLWGKRSFLEKMPPFLTGGEMVQRVDKKFAEWQELPFKFEAGTQNAEGVIGFGEALNYLSRFPMRKIREHEKVLVKYTLEKLKNIPKLKVLGPKNPAERGGVISFLIDRIHPHDLASFLSDEGICIRAGHHCVMPAHSKLGILASARISFYIYNEKKDVNDFIVALKKAIKLFS